MTSSIPVTVVRVSSVPPSAPKAMPVRAAPSISGTALAAPLDKRDTRGGQLRQERDALTERSGAARHREQSEQDQGGQQRQGHGVRGAGEIEESAAVGRQARP